MKVFYVTTFGNNVFYVRAENAETAKEHLIEQVTKYFFKRELAGDENTQAPETLGPNIIVELGIHKSILDSNEKLIAEDITAMAYVFGSMGRPYWKDWSVSMDDVVIG
jgi:hypothetical protein